ncbi:MAG: hypothetical protein GWN86_10710 [Desulfobacterales bacterium]|nr:hypothetical protein [Desulfobacterales bacterium]
MSKVLKFQIDPNYPKEGCTVTFFDKKGRVIFLADNLRFATENAFDDVVRVFRFDDGEMPDEYYQILPDGTEKRVMV